MRTSRGGTLILLGFFFGSGASALVYQVLWHRQLSLVLGVTVYATTTVLAAFMMGLAIGSAIGGRLADRLPSPLRAFGLVELAIGFTAFSTQFLLGGVSWVYPALANVTPSSPGVPTLVRFLCATAVLLVPTVLMGMTFPLVLKGAIAGQPSAHRRIAWLYGAQHDGRGVGRALDGVRSRRQHRHARVVCRGGRRQHHRRPRCTGARPSSRPREQRRARRLAQRVPGGRLAPRASDWRSLRLSGLAALALEVVWFRLLVYFVPATTYAFTTMLASVLLGLAAGSWLVSMLPARPRNWMRLLVGLQAATALAVPLAATALVSAYSSGLAPAGDWLRQPRVGAAADDAHGHVVPRGTACVGGLARDRRRARWLACGKPERGQPRGRHRRGNSRRVRAAPLARHTGGARRAGGCLPRRIPPPAAPVCQ